MPYGWATLIDPGDLVAIEAFDCRAVLAATVVADDAFRGGLHDGVHMAPPAAARPRSTVSSRPSSLDCRCSITCE